MSALPELAQGLDFKQAEFAPGQTSQRIGMGKDLADNSPVAKKVWTDSNAILLSQLGFNFSKLVWEGSPDDLKKTENGQPAIIITALAAGEAMDVWRQTDQAAELGLAVQPGWRSGMSLGFIVACNRVRAIDKGATVTLAAARGKAFEVAKAANGDKETTLMAIQHDDPKVVEQAVADVSQRFELDGCLYNTYNQVVVGGEVKNILAAKADLTLRDRKLGEMAVPLGADMAYHSRWLNAGVDVYGEAVDRLDVQEPTAGKLIAGSMIDVDEEGKVTVTPILTAADIKLALRKQLNHAERWRELVVHLGKEGVTKVVELNTRSTLVDMSKRLQGGEREKIVLPGEAKGSDGKEITLGWRWEAPQAVKQVVEELVLEAGDDPYLKVLQELYGDLPDDPESMEQFLALDAPKGSREQVLLWYKKWCAIKKGKPVAEINETDHFVDDIEIDSLDLSQLRADVMGAYERLVDEAEAEKNVTPGMAADATWGLLQEE